MDGPWATFALRVGTPPQIIRVLPATAKSGIFVNLPPENCQSSQYAQYCSNGTRVGAWNPRVGTFDPHNSTTWNVLGNYSLKGIDDYLFSHPQSGVFGYDNVGLDTDAFGTSGMVNQSVVGIMGYDLGLFGLSPDPLNFSDVTKSSPTFFGTLQANTRIPSRTWSFTQGVYKGKFSFKPLL